MNIIVMNIKRLLKRKVNIIFMFVSPLIMVMFASMMGSSTWDLNIAYTNNDGSSTSIELIETLKDVGSVYEILPEDAKINLIQANYDVYILIDEDFEEKLLNGEKPKVSIKTLKGTNVAFPATTKIQSFLSSAYTMALSSNGNRELYLSMQEDYIKGLSELNIETAQSLYSKRFTTRMGIGFLIMNMLFLAAVNSQVLLEDKRKKVFYRIFSGPISTFSYMFYNIVSFYIIMLLQIGVIMLAMFGIFGMYPGPSLLNMFISLAIFGLLCVSFGVSATTLSKNERQASTVTTLLIVPMCMLGGCFWDISMMPKALQSFSKFVPASWGIRLAENILEGKMLSEVLTEIGVILLFTAGFFVLGSLRKADIGR